MLLVAAAMAVGCAVDPVCYQDADCPSGERCVQSTGRCMEGDCAKNEDCQPGFECKERSCVPAAEDASGCPAELQCPEGMVPVSGAWCGDRYEASRKDATEDGPGADDSVALSTAGVMPWAVKPMSAAAFELFKGACEAAGKSLCGTDEWQFACAGESKQKFAYGETYDPEACNSVDTWCDDFCSTHGIDPCVSTKNCGYTPLARASPTASRLR